MVDITDTRTAVVVDNATDESQLSCLIIFLTLLLISLTNKDT